MTTPIISSFNNKGGVGKTNVIVNMAALAANPEKPVLLIDADQQGDASDAFGINKKAKGLFQIFHEEADLAECVHAAPGVPGLWIIPPGEGMKELGRPSDVMESESRPKISAFEYSKRLRALVERISEGTPNGLSLAVVDLPPTFTTVTDFALLASDRLLVPMKPSPESIKAIAELLEQVIQKRAYNPSLAILGVVVTMFKKNSDQEQYVLQCHSSFPAETAFFETIIPENQASSSAVSFDKPVVIYDKGGRGAKAYRALYVEFKARLQKEFAHVA